MVAAATETRPVVSWLKSLQRQATRVERPPPEHLPPPIPAFFHTSAIGDHPPSTPLNPPSTAERPRGFLPNHHPTLAPARLPAPPPCHPGDGRLPPPPSPLPAPDPGPHHWIHPPWRRAVGPSTASFQGADPLPQQTRGRSIETGPREESDRLPPLQRGLGLKFTGYQRDDHDESLCGTPAHPLAVQHAATTSTKWVLRTATAGAMPLPSPLDVVPIWFPSPKPYLDELFPVC
ncbi:formin-like protein 5 [Triticum aestivum]|uniref:formin-like protein 5 n=1 Tax=Triticum aestivum TaxID=4565 RepID=UPI001D02DFF4|nr:formin-like protein 5 [Triticum aestivum]